MFQLREVRTGDPIAHGRVQVFPLFREDDGGDARCVLADEAIEAGGVEVLR